MPSFASESAIQHTLHAGVGFLTACAHHYVVLTSIVQIGEKAMTNEESGLAYLFPLSATGYKNVD